nr:hypothetical protein [Candidatus Palauibacterales bacterium]
MTADSASSRDGSLDLYLRDIAGSDPLPRAREAELAHRWRQAGDRQALEAIVVLLSRTTDKDNLALMGADGWDGDLLVRYEPPAGPAGAG